MTHKPTTYAGGKGPRQRLWEAIRAQGDGLWTLRDISDKAGIDASSARGHVRGLRSAGIIEIAREEPCGNNGLAIEHWYRLIKDEGVEAPRLRMDGSRVLLGLGHEQMWRTLRLLSGDTNARELAAHASTAAVPVRELSAKGYLRMLAMAGYLVVTVPSKVGGNRGSTPPRYRLKPSRNTGPRPPVVCRANVVYDPNEDKIVWQAPVTDEDALHG